ncbi:MAG TPA: hypothetical protein VI306_20420 [Pyrinomonadaceae bacterium]
MKKISAFKFQISDCVNHEVRRVATVEFSQPFQRLEAIVRLSASRSDA